MNSIRVKITAVTIAAILTCILSLGFIGVYTVGRVSNQYSVEKLNLMSENMAKTLDAYLDSLQQSVDMAINIANDTTADLEADLIAAAAESPEQMEKLNAFLKEHSADILRSFTSIANNTAGVVTYYYCINMDLGSTEHGFFYSKVGSENFEEQVPLYSDDLDPEDIEHTTWYYTPIQNHAPTWIGPYLAHYLEERWTVSYVAPIYKNDILLGVLGMDILFATMIDQVANLKIYDSGFAILLDKDGRVLYHPFLKIGDIPENVADSLNSEMFLNESSGNQLIRYNTHGEYRQLAFSTLSNGMRLVVTAPVSEITAYQQQLVTIFIIIAGIILVIFTIVTLILMDHLTRPLLQLSAASQKIADGDYDVALDYQENDEVGILTNSFRQMRDRLKLYISDLNSRAYSDALTGIKNKAAFNIFAEILNDKIRLGDENDMPEFAIIVFDCNELKQINDKYGHERGDIYLRASSALICKVFIHSPVFRVGGDEFVVLLQNQDYDDHAQLLEYFDQKSSEINALAENPWEVIDISKGMAIFQPGSDTSVEQVMNRADAQMYQDKKSHKSANE